MLAGGEGEGTGGGGERGGDEEGIRGRGERGGGGHLMLWSTAVANFPPSPDWSAREMLPSGLSDSLGKLSTCRGSGGKVMG